MRLSFIIFLFLLLGFSLSCNAQSYPHTSILGNYGCIQNPTARFAADRTLTFSWSYLPQDYLLIQNRDELSSENIITGNVMFLSFMEVSASLIRPVNIAEHPWGIGDRSYKVRFKITEEKKYLPAIALGIHDPISGVTRQGALYLVASKSFSILPVLQLDCHLGYGLDTEMDVIGVRDLFTTHELYETTRLKGVFGGAHLSYRNHLLLLEYDTQQINAGYSLLLFGDGQLGAFRLRAGVYTLGFDALSAQLNVAYLFGGEP